MRFAGLWDWDPSLQGAVQGGFGCGCCPSKMGLKCVQAGFYPGIFKGQGLLLCVHHTQLCYGCICRSGSVPTSAVMSVAFHF